MTSRRQLEANRANAKRSTGPKSSDGKARSRMNGVKHGLTAKQIVIGDEDPDELESLRADLDIEFEPRGRLHHELVDHLAGLLWRRRRMHALEAALVKAREAEVRAELEEEQENERWGSIQAEARRRCNEFFEDDHNVILNAQLNGTYGARLTNLSKRWKPNRVIRSKMRTGRTVAETWKTGC